MTVAEHFTFRDLLREPKRVSDAVDRERRVVISRRNAPDLIVTRADLFEDELSGAGGLARLLGTLAAHVSADELGRELIEALPWTRYLSDAGRREFVTELAATLEACAELGTLVPFGQLLVEWKSTAAVLADPALAAHLTAPIGKPDGRMVAAP